MILLLLVFLCACMCACEKKQAQVEATPTPAPTLSDKGRSIYTTYCTACHNIDPKKDGSLGPSVWGSNRELLVARVLHGNYPEGYSPKRKSKTMIAIPQLVNDIDVLHEFLNK